MLTLVTGFFRLGDREVDEEDYLRKFDALAIGGSPILLFFDRARMERAPRWPNVEVRPAEKLELWPFERADRLELRLPERRTPGKDSREFLLLQNAKLDLLERATHITSEAELAWIDFGIMKTVRGQNSFLTRLGRMRLEREIVSPGCWSREISMASDRGAVDWRFCGSFISAKREAIPELHARYRNLFEEFVQEGFLTWEINLWAELERRGLDFGWYSANHDDSLIR